MLVLPFIHVAHFAELFGSEGSVVGSVGLSGVEDVVYPGEHSDGWVRTRDVHIGGVGGVPRATAALPVPVSAGNASHWHGPSHDALSWH